MVAIAFDTLLFSHKLEDAGMSREQAEKFAEIQKEIVEAQNAALQDSFDKKLSNNVATKEDILNVREDMLNLKHELKLDIQGLNKKIEALQQEFQGKFNLLYWMFGFIAASYGSIIFKLYF